MSQCKCFYDRGDGVLVSHAWSIQVTDEDIVLAAQGLLPDVRLEDPRPDGGIAVIGAFFHNEHTGEIYRLDHYDRVTNMVHGIWPD